MQRTKRAMWRLAGGSAVSKLITLVSLPILTRLYTPDDFGALGMFLAGIALFVPLVTLQYNHAIPLPRTDAAASMLALLAMLSVSVSSVLLLMLLLVAAGYVFPIFGIDVLVPYYWLFPLGALVIGLHSVAKMWHTRKRRYNMLMVEEAAQSGIGNGLKVLLGLVPLQPLGLLFGQIAQMSAGLVVISHGFVRDFRQNTRYMSRTRLKRLARQYATFPLYRAPSQMISSLGMHMPVLFIAPIYGLGTAGQFSLAMTALAMPVNLIGNSIGKAFYAEAANVGSNKPEEIRVALKQAIKMLGLIGAGLAVILAGTSVYLFPLIFGAEWRAAGQFAAILSILMAARFVSSPLIAVLSVFRREDMYLRIDIQRVIIVAMAFSVAYVLNFEVISALVLYAALTAIHHVTSGVMIYRAAR